MASEVWKRIATQVTDYDTVQKQIKFEIFMLFKC